MLEMCVVRLIKKVKGFKVLTWDLRDNPNFTYRIGETMTTNGELEMYENGLHLYKSLENVSVEAL